MAGIFCGVFDNTIPVLAGMVVIHRDHFDPASHSFPIGESPCPLYGSARGIVHYGGDTCAEIAPIILCY